MKMKIFQYILLPIAILLVFALAGCTVQQAAKSSVPVPPDNLVGSNPDSGSINNNAADVSGASSQIPEQQSASAAPTSTASVSALPDVPDDLVSNDSPDAGSIPSSNVDTQPLS